MDIDYSRAVPTVAVVHPISGERMVVNVSDYDAATMTLWDAPSVAPIAEAMPEAAPEEKTQPRRKGRARRG